MIQLPAKVEDVKELRAGMEDFARQVFRDWGDKKKVRDFTPTLRASFKNLFKAGAQQHVDTMQDILNLARGGDPIADEAVRELYREMKYVGRRPPVILEVYVEFEVSRRGLEWRFPKKHGKKKFNYILRNLGIVYTVAALVDAYGLHPTKRTDSNTIAASEIVGAILRPALGHKAVEEVWRVYGGAAPTVPGFWASSL
jgi:hypothetical protein